MKKILNILILIIVSNFLIYQSITYSQTPSKLDALESAYRAGILTEQEYNAKKAELEATKSMILVMKRALNLLIIKNIFV